MQGNHGHIFEELVPFEFEGEWYEITILEVKEGDAEKDLYFDFGAQPMSGEAKVIWANEWIDKGNLWDFSVSLKRLIEDLTWEY